MGKFLLICKWFARSFQIASERPFHTIRLTRWLYSLGIISSIVFKKALEMNVSFNRYARSIGQWLLWPTIRSSLSCVSTEIRSVWIRNPRLKNNKFTILNWLIKPFLLLSWCLFTLLFIIIANILYSSLSYIWYPNSQWLLLAIHGNARFHCYFLFL